MAKIKLFEVYLDENGRGIVKLTERVKKDLSNGDIKRINRALWKISHTITSVIVKEASADDSQNGEVG